MFSIDIKSARKAKGMTQEQVGILAGMSKSQISRIENGTLGGPETYERLLSALGYRIIVSLEEMNSSSELNRDLILSQLKVYYLYNKDKYGIERLGLFGSFARGDNTQDSDIDIIISLTKPNLLTYSTIAQHLETVFGRKVDLISAKAILKDSFRKNIEKDVIYVS